MMHLFFTGDKEKLEEEFWAVAKESGMMLCRGLVPTDERNVWKMEVTVSNTSLDLDTLRMRELMGRVLKADN
jgi:hypothetical protein